MSTADTYPTQAEFAEWVNWIYATDPDLYAFILFYEDESDDSGDYDERAYLMGDYDECHSVNY